VLVKDLRKKEDAINDPSSSQEYTRFKLFMIFLLFQVLTAQRAVLELITQKGDGKKFALG
jgi:hypothetical protein